MTLIETNAVLDQAPTVPFAQIDALPAPEPIADAALPGADVLILPDLNRFRNVGAVVLLGTTIGGRVLQTIENVVPGAYGAVVAATRHGLDWATSIGTHHTSLFDIQLAAYEAPMDMTTAADPPAAPEITIASGATWSDVLAEFGLTKEQASAFMVAHGGQLEHMGAAYGEPGDWRVNLGTPIADAHGKHGIMDAQTAEWIRTSAVHDGYLADTQPSPVDEEPIAPPPTTSQPTPTPTPRPTDTPQFLPGNTLPIHASASPSPSPTDIAPGAAAQKPESGSSDWATILASLGFTAASLWVINHSNTARTPRPPFGTNDWFRSFKLFRTLSNAIEGRR